MWCVLSGVSVCVQDFRGCVQDLGAPADPTAGPLLRRTAQYFALVSLARHIFHSFFRSLGGPFVEVRWCLKCARLGSPNVRISRPPALQTPPKFHEKTPRDEERKKIVVGEGKKSAKFWPPTLRAPPFGAHPSGPHFGPPLFPRFWLQGPHPSGPHPLHKQPSSPTCPGPHTRSS